MDEPLDTPPLETTPSEPDNPPPDSPLEESKELAQNTKAGYPDLSALNDAVYHIDWRWSYFEITVVSPNITLFVPPKWIKPELIPGTEDYEFVYPILDYGNRMITSKQDEFMSAGYSMCKMYYTIEKIIDILVGRLSQEGIPPETEVQVAFGGHRVVKRKAFEIIINLDNNVVVSNFDPGEWGEKYLRVVKWQGEQGYGYPSKAPRDVYKKAPKTMTAKPK
ncbi:MAG: hypothetical protein A3F18_03525 [Legionellales bacterium RIFCSPHIGHO2_12_FULL_37_14]|nr:MAG: hypothetical protein A3F18_03525 [Legionellales bacterium RIFCSPHIGHO2_12_FULL_37_14]